MATAVVAEKGNAMKLIYLLAGLFVGVAVTYLLGCWAYNKQYNREKRAEKIKRELDDEERMGRLLHSRLRIYKTDGMKGQIIDNR